MFTQNAPTSGLLPETILNNNIAALDKISDVCYDVLDKVITDNQDILYRPEGTNSGAMLFKDNVINIIVNNLKNKLSGANV